MPKKSTIAFVRSRELVTKKPEIPMWDANLFSAEEIKMFKEAKMYNKEVIIYRPVRKQFHDYDFGNFERTLAIFCKTADDFSRAVAYFTHYLKEFPKISQLSAVWNEKF